MGLRPVDETLQIRISAELRRAAAERAEAELLSVSAWLRRLIRDAVEPPRLSA